MNNLDYLLRDIVKKEIEQWLSDYFKNKNDLNKLIYESMEYSLKVGGKRIRPILMLLTFSMYNPNYKEIMPLGAAIEMIHTYSLIHDDLPCMDNDDLRRGKPTNHKVFGEAIAVLSGDALLNEAMNIMFRLSTENNNVLKACTLLSQCSGAEGMIGGQVVDIISEGKKTDLETLLYMHKNKTGALIKAAILCGAICGEAPNKDIELLEKFGEKIGLAFQIKDDVLDVTGNTKVLGKKIKSDENNNKTNFITEYGLSKCEEICEKLTNESMEILSEVSVDTKELKELTKYLLIRNC